MTTMDMVETRHNGASSTPKESTAGEAPSGFILKLYQMVNGAPNEVISWTPAGDAFIIGSDLKRLESETLPQYFRHNRFQSLVRQLNFYSFRKINRERNVWIYKHELFRRDRPEDLHLVRRRTCPGLDGRKQRFSRFSARKLSQSESDGKSDDESSLDVNSVEELKQTPTVKREQDDSERSVPPPTKRSRVSTGSATAAVLAKETELVVDTSMLQLVKTLVEEEEQVSLSTAKTDRVDMVEQSIIVSEVAMKLEEHARKAMRGRGLSRSRRSASGVVTPPYGAGNGFFNMSSLLTYDDEYGAEDDHVDDGSGYHSLGVVTEGDDSSERSFSSVAHAVTPIKYQGPPVRDSIALDGITRRLVKSGLGYEQPHLIEVSLFCMTTSPTGDKDMCTKILQLVSSSEQLSSEFSLYLSALHPSMQGEEPSLLWSPGMRDNRAITVQQIWESASSRCDAVRDFKIFAVNCLHKIFKFGSNKKICVSDEDHVTLERTADVWQRSVGTSS